MIEENILIEEDEEEEEEEEEKEKKKQKYFPNSKFSLPLSFSFDRRRVSLLGFNTAPVT